MLTEAKRKFVLVASEVPEEVIKRAQVAIITDVSWSLIGAGQYRAHGFNGMPMPKVTCPIVDVSGLPEEVDRAVSQAIRECTAPIAGVTDLNQLLSRLRALGGRVTNQPSVSDGGPRAKRRTRIMTLQGIKFKE